MLKIKVCGLRDIENVTDVAGTFPDFMGFIFYQGSPRFVGKEVSNSLFNDIPPEIIKTGVFVNEITSKVRKAVDRFKLDAVQFHGSESADYCRHFMLEGLITIKAFGIEPGFEFKILNSYMNSCDYFLFDTITKTYGGSGKKFDWSILGEYELDKPFFISGGISFEEIREVLNLKHNALFGVDINSRFELSPGIKDAELIRSFINKIKSQPNEI